MSIIHLSNAIVYDPINGINGVRKDIWIKDGKIIAPVDPHGHQIRQIDLAGKILMPGGIDMHTHIAGPKVNAARKMQPEVNRAASTYASCDGQPFFHSGLLANVPSSLATGYRYTQMGYTTCFDAAVTPLAARHVHQELQDIPNVDTGFFTLVGNNHYVMKCIAEDDQDGLDTFLSWLLTRVGSYAPKLVNPGGVELWKQSPQGNGRDLSQLIPGFDITPRQIIADITAAANRVNLPHPVHIHCNNLGMPGNWSTTLETMKCLEDHTAHLTHVQFHSYGGGESDPDSLMSMTQPLAEWINRHPNLSVDVGQVLFGKTMSMTGDAPLGHYLQQLNQNRWYASDVELESGCGVSPIEYRNKNFVHALQWAIGLEWYLLVENPWQIVMTTDHPNGGSFWAYPQIVRLLMDRSYREEMLATVNPKILQHSALADLSREYSLYEIAIITRAAPAKLLGLTSKGHLGTGADADIAVYTQNTNYEQMFANPSLVLKGGVIVLEDGEFRAVVSGKTIGVDSPYDPDREVEIDNWFDSHYSLKSAHYGLTPAELARLAVQR